MGRMLLRLVAFATLLGVAGCSSHSHARQAPAPASAKSPQQAANLKPVLARSSQTDSGVGVSILPSSAQVTAGDSVDVTVQATAPSQGLGAWTIEVQYDPSVLSPTNCSTAQSLTEVCNPSYNGSTVLLAGLAASGVSGTQTLATITFSAQGDVGATSALTVVVDSFADPTGADIPSPAPSNGQVSVVAPS